MDNELEVKSVDFMGNGLIAAKDSEGTIWASVSALCKGMGLTKDQIGYERKKIQGDLVLCQGVKFYPLGTDNANSDVLCLQIDYVPLWLAKIPITPNMKETNPELVETLVNYQLKAKDVLAAAFLPKAHNVKQLTITSRDVARFNALLFYISSPVSLITRVPLKSQFRILAISINSFSLKLSRFSLFDKLLWEVPRLVASSVMDIFRFTNAIRIFSDIAIFTPTFIFDVFIISLKRNKINIEMIKVENKC